MLQKHFQDIVLKQLGFDFSQSQKLAMGSFVDFLFDRNPETVFVLKGYAGTGKTSLVAAIVNALQEFRQKVVLLAPTGRAAKVFSSYAGISAFTIHKKIYRQKDAAEGRGNFNIGFNADHHTLFFVDEASMVSNSGDDSNFGSGRLLDDLMEFVYNGRNNRLILIGDTAQLPPVGLELSPALDADQLRYLYNMHVFEAALTDVMRQTELSGILYNATRIRRLIGENRGILQLSVSGFPDVYNINGTELLEELDGCYGKFGLDETMVICYSNKRARRFNEGIRRTILYREDEFCSGDKVMIVKNNYFWGKAYDQIDFIANGDIATVVRVGKRMDVYGFRFIKTELNIAGYEEDISAWALLDTLSSDYPSLGYEESKKMYTNIEQEYADIGSKKKRWEKVRDNEFYNALQIKFAYAVTCHKAQGGQWDAVFIDQGWIPEEGPDDSYWRWLYTAVTRARKRVYFVNFKEEYFIEKN